MDIQVTMIDKYFIEDLERNYEERIELFYLLSSDLIVDNVSKESPVLTGALRDSFFMKGSIREGLILSSDLPYAWKQNELIGFVEIGLSKSESEVQSLFEEMMGGL